MFCFRMPFSSTRSVASTKALIHRLALLQPIKAASPEEERQSEALREAFDKIAGDDMEIDAYELRDILNAAFRRGKSPARWELVFSSSRGHERFPPAASF